MSNQSAIELIFRMNNLLLTSTTRTPYQYNSIWEWRKEVENKIKEIKKKEKIQ